MGHVRYVVGGSLAAAATATLLFVGCSSEHPGSARSAENGGSNGTVLPGTDDGVGQVRMRLDIGPGTSFTSFTYTITGPNTYTGMISIGDAQSLEFVVGGIVAGTGYTLSINGNDSAGEACVGTSSPFNVNAGAVTQTVLGVVCTVPSDSSINADVTTGSVEVDAAVVRVPAPQVICPGITSFSISPAELATGQSAQLTLSDTDPSVQITWTVAGVSPSGAGGTFSDPHSANPTFTCSQGNSQVSVMATIVSTNDAAAVLCVGHPFQTMSALVYCESTGPDAGVCGNGASGIGCGDGGQVCNGAGQCVPAAFSVAIVGAADGGAIGNNNTVPLAIQQYALSGAPIGDPVALPTVASGKNNPCTLIGTSLTEGDLNTSVDGRYVSMMCWAAAPGVQLNGVPPVIARVDALGNVDTSTLASGAFTGGGNNARARSAISTDGGAFWIGGASSSTVTSGNTGGVWYLPFGADGGTQILSLPNTSLPTAKARWLKIFAGQLFGDSDQAPPYVFTLGNGLPTTGPQTPAEIPGLPNDGGTAGTASPYSFVLFDLDGTPGLETGYLADDRVNVGGGISKWHFDGSAWVSVWNINAGTSDAGTPIGFRGLAGFSTGTTVTLMASTAARLGNPDQLAVIVDNGGAPPVPTMIASSSPSQVFRGVALAPHN